MRKFKKGFTIVELVIVIAVIAVLAAVLVPTFSNIIEKANISNDIQLVKNLNTAVSLELQMQGQTNARYATAYETTVVTARNGYLVDKIVSRSSLDIAWSRGTGRFVLVNTETGDIVYPSEDGIEKTNVTGDEINYFIFRDKMPTEGNDLKYSVFAGDKWKEKDVIVNAVGFDAGYNTNIKSVTYNNPAAMTNDEIILRTNADNLTLNINDKTLNGRVLHYGQAGYLNIIDCAPQSYYEYGEISLVKMATGRIVLMKDSDVEHVHFSTTEGEFESIIVGYQDGVELPDFSRDDVVIADTGTLVVQLQNIDKDSKYIWLYNQGTLSQMAVVDVEITGIVENGTKLEGVVVDSTNIDICLGVVNQEQEMRKAACQIANLYNGANVDNTYDVFKLNKKAPQVDQLGNIIGQEDLSQVVSDGSKDITEEIKTATCQHENLGKSYTYDADSHWIVCPDCNKHLHVGEHDSDGPDYACSVCGYITGKIINKKVVDYDKNTLTSVVTQINNEISSGTSSHSTISEKQYEYKIELPGGPIGGTEATGKEGYIADVYVIKQYPTWNGKTGSGENGSNISSTEWKQAKNATITVIGSSDKNNPTIFTGVFVVVGHGNLTGDWQASPELASTTFKNIQFDQTGLIGTKDGDRIITNDKKIGNDDWGANPITCGSGSQNVYVENCSFKNTGRLNFGYSAGGTGTVVYQKEGDSIKSYTLQGYSYNPKITDCTFDNITTVAQGYFHGKLDNFEIKGCSGTAGSFINDQTGMGNTFIINDCNITFTKSDGYMFRSNKHGTAIFTNCVFSRLETHDTAAKNGLIALRKDSGSNLTFNNCTFTGDKYCNAENGVYEDTKITFNKCSGITQYSDIGCVSGKGIAESYFIFNN